MMNGVGSATFFVLPMLGKHPEEYPRFRDCFIGDKEHTEYDDMIHIYTRVGGENRDDYEKEIEALRSSEGYVTDFDDNFDCTYCTFVFRVPEQFKADFKLFKENKIKDFSTEYRRVLYATFPKLKEQFDILFV